MPSPLLPKSVPVELAMAATPQPHWLKMLERAPATGVALG